MTEKCRRCFDAGHRVASAFQMWNGGDIWLCPECAWYKAPLEGDETYIDGIPIEILQLVSGYLDKVSHAFFSMTCHAIRDSIGTPALQGKQNLLTTCGYCCIMQECRFLSGTLQWRKWLCPKWQATWQICPLCGDMCKKSSTCRCATQ